ncbi:unnamed protein product [Rotaria sp. Silwood1]|nr:unnamed protein product [Rotaria sp. Silwood1]CAF1540320.1 unnamed protein product [Rotaria sp. Silwood1]CAF3645754.1 unnamed protein product [Rotaria sp. Silwood1]CAF3697613.1 unnamed protein product [Rotaria sp. Silwood1]
MVDDRDLYSSWRFWLERKDLIDYFPIRLHKTCDLSPDCSYIFGYHPHGINCLGGIGNFATEATSFENLFPGINLRFLVLNSNFGIPFFEIILTMMGICDVSKESCNYILKQGKGNSIMLVIGGSREVLDARPSCEYLLTLKNRKGFIKIALANGASLVPVFSFGENDLYEQDPNPRGSKLRKVQMFLQQKTGYALPLFYGRRIFQSKFGLLPYRHPIDTYIGERIKIPKLSPEHITPEIVDEYHEKYLTGMACFGPASGLRTMIFSRYSWGYYSASIMSIVNVMSAIGWAVVNSINGAQTLRVVFNDSFPITVGIIIIAIITMIISFIGYKWIHIYELYSWIPVFIGYCILAGVDVKYFTNSEMTNQNWKQAYEIDNVGGLLRAILSPLRGFGKFIFILFSLSIVACNIPNLYSLSLSTQVIAPIFSRIPRFLYTVIGTAAYVLLAIVAASKFNGALTSVMGISSYWSAIFMVIVFEDHILFRRCSFRNYNFSIWNSSKLLPISLAAILSALVGVAGIILGMSQIWFSGPIAKAIAEDTDIEGADIGFEAGFIFTAAAFPLFRLIELDFIRR